MIQILPPKIIYTPDDAEYVTTYVLDEEGNPTDELANYEKLEKGFYAISDELIEGMTQYAGKGLWAPLSGVKTYCYQWPDKAAYELDFPPEPVEEIPEPIASEPASYDLEAGQTKANLVINSWYNRQFKVLQNGYPDTMLLNFATKKEEALRVVAGGTSSFLNGLEKDGRTTLEFARRILELAGIYEQGLIDIENALTEGKNAVKSATSEQEINEIMRGFI